MILLPEGKASDSKQSLPLPGGALFQQGPGFPVDDIDTRSIAPSIASGSQPARLPPPRYIENHPRTQITYDFIPQTNPANGMVMCPPAYLRTEYAAYFISVNMNVFTPFSYITTVRRNGWDGEIIGDFEMGISGLRKLNTVCIRGYECPIEEVLEINTKMFRGGTTYLWKSKKVYALETVNLYWEESSFASTSTLTCYLGKERTAVNLLAKFMPNTILRRPGKPQSLTRVDITPKGHDYLDEVVISMLIVERMRTSPSALKDLPTSMLKEFF